MGRFRGLGGWGTAALAVVCAAQSVPTDPVKAAAPANAEVGGTQAFDLIPIDGTSQGIALRFGNVVPGSERVSLDGAVLQSPADYALDAEAGVVYLKRAARTGSSLSATYRYVADRERKTASPTGIGRFALNLAGQGRLGLIGGLGLTERTEKGGIIRANAFGLRNNFSFGGGGLLGAVVVADRKRVAAQAGFSMDPNAKAGEATDEEGSSRFVLQNFSTKTLGGEIVAEYQDISENFASFGQAIEAGIDGKMIDRLRAERGLTRLGFGAKDVRVGGMALSQNFRTVKDDDGSIDWRSYGIRAGGLKVDYTGRTVSAGFTRFRDLREEDREQLMRERGMSRQNLTGEWAMKGGKLGFEALSVSDDATGQSITRREIQLDASKFKFSVGDQEVAKSFGRFDSLLGDERNRYGREAGLSRQWASLESSLGGAALALKENRLRSDQGSFVSRDGSLKGKNWQIEHNSRTVRDGFTSLSSMAENEMDSHIRSIAGMYGPSVAPRPEDRGAFARSARLERSSTKLLVTPAKAFLLAMQRTELQGAKGGATIDTINLSAGRLSADYRKQNVASDFGEFGSLMEFERNAMGQVSGLARTDLAVRYDHRKATQFRFSQTKASNVDGGLTRTSAGYDDGKLSVAFNAREVDANFAAAGQMLDAERELLGTLRGFSQRDVKVNWKMLPGVQLDLFRFDAANAATGEDRLAENLSLNWSPNAGSSLGFVSNRLGSRDANGIISAQRYTRIDLKSDLGRFGKIAIADESVDNDGRSNNAPDLRRRFLAYETQLGKRVRLRTEQSRTAFSDGQKENVSSNTVATELTSRLGVSVTDTAIDRGGERDEKKRNYGVWFDLGKGLRVTWGYARHLNGDNSTGSSTFGLASNVRPEMTAQEVASMQTARVGDVNIGGAYGVNQWDAQVRTQSFANVGFSTAKAINLGPLRDVNFRFSYDAAADRSAWARENRFASFSGKLAGVTLGYDYRGQIDPSGNRGIDRTFLAKTDPDNKKWLRGSFMYKVRTLPDNRQVMIRDVDVTMRLAKNVELTHQLQTNPEQFRGDVFLGSVPQAHRASRWRLDQSGNANFRIGGQWEQLANDLERRSTTTAGLNLTLFANSPSPIRLFYGMEDQNGMNVLRQGQHRYSIQFDQRPGPNQLLSIFAGNVSYEHVIAQGFRQSNWTVRLNYQLRF